jgi:hypothetical protein
MTVHAHEALFAEHTRQLDGDELVELFELRVGLVGDVD